MFSAMIDGRTDAQLAAQMQELLPRLRDVAPDLADELEIRMRELQGVCTSARQVATQVRYQQF